MNKLNINQTELVCYRILNINATRNGFYFSLPIQKIGNKLVSFNNKKYIYTARRSEPNGNCRK